MQRIVLRLSIAILIASIMISASLSNVQAAIQTTSVSNTVPSGDSLSWRFHGMLIPPIPDALGCYIFSNARWASMPCIYQSAEGHPRFGEGSYYSVLGIGASPITVNNGWVSIQFSKFSGESDTQYGGGDWSLQLNTNDFRCNNGHVCVVQFVEANDPAACWGWCGNACMHTEAVDVTTQTYNDYPCAGTRTQGLNNNYFSTVHASTSSGHLNAEYCDNSNTCWATSANDDYHLAGNWAWATGQILGLQNGSTASFTSPTSLSTTSEVFSSSSISGNAVSSTRTQEMNNLNWGTTSTSCWYDVGYYCDAITPSNN